LQSTMGKRFDWMATSHKYKQSFTKWSWGAELEFVDWPRNDPLPHGMAIDEGNYTSVNSNGVAVDGKGKTYPLGGEILTAPSEDINEPSEQMLTLQRHWPQMTHNYRTGLNTHVRVPGLRDDLKKLKQLQSFAHRVLPEILPLIDPILVPEYKSFERAYKGALKNYNTRKRDHHTLLSPERLALQMKARTPKEFFEAEVIDEKTGKLHWAIRPRTAVNLRQMLQTDSIEFRHWFMPYTPEQLLDTVRWSKYFLEAAFDGSDISGMDLLAGFKLKSSWPICLPYDPWLDRGFYFTSPHTNPPGDVPTRIIKWLSDQEQEIKRRKADNLV
jgi:hypothetical protein